MVFRHADPSLQLFDHTIDEQSIHLFRVCPQRIVLLLVEANGIRSRIRDGLFDRFGLRGGQILARLSCNPRAKPSVSLSNDRCDRLGSQVASDEERIRLVELRGRQELAKDDFGAAAKNRRLNLCFVEERGKPATRSQRPLLSIWTEGHASAPLPGPRMRD